MTPPDQDDSHPEHASARRAAMSAAETSAPRNQGTTPLVARPDQPPPDPTFANEEVVDGRFRIVRFLAQGGMGQVYEAEDLELGTPVALKTIREDVALNDRAIERFKREINLSRRVTHPNVCRIFEFGRHQRPEDPEDGVTFLTMELLPGDTLADLIARSGRLSEGEALPIVRQMVAALAAAHAAGVVHRDFKSSNVLLVPLEQGGPPRAVVTDFGLARSVDGSYDSGGSGSGSGGLVLGTPAYVAPEQVDGADVTAAADIYALGVVMFEMVTGRPPFVGETVLATVVKRLQEPAPSPRTFVPSLDERWEQVILRCLERDPAHRPADPLDVIRTLEGSGALPPVARTSGPLREELRDGDSPASRRRAGRLMAAAIVLGVGLAGLFLAASHGLPGWPRGPRSVVNTQVTSSSGLDLHPTFSPSGEKMAFASDRTGAFELYVRSSTPTGADTRLTSDGQQNVQPAWSPDGRFIAYHSKGRGGIWLMPAEGGTPRQLTTFGSRPRWSAQGDAVAYQSEALLDVAPNAVGAMPPSTIWYLRIGGSPVQVTQAGSPPGGHGSPAWAPDGRHLVFTTSDRHTAQLWSVAVDGSELLRFPSPHLYAYDPVFSPDGDRLYYSAVAETGHFGLWMVPMSAGRPGTEPERLVDLAFGTGRHLALSPDGKHLAYSNLQMSSNLLSVAAEGGEPRPVTVEAGRNARPIFSPDGSKIAFERWRPGSNPDIWVMDADGSNARQLTSHPAVDTVANWTPDGTTLVFRSDRAGKAALWSYDLRTGKEAEVQKVEQDLDWPRLSPDGRMVAFNSRSGGGGAINVWLVPFGGSPAQQLTYDSQSVGFPTWSPDGKVLAVEMKRGEVSHVALQTVDGGPLEQLTDDRGQSWPCSFSPDGDRVAFAGLRRGYWNVFWVSRTSKEVRQLTRFTRLSSYVRYPAWSPRGDRLVFERAQTQGNVWQLSGL
jgi:Tol biopolymer transport system component